MICFDVADEKRLRQVAIQLENVGLRVQCSVFECFLDIGDLETLKENLGAIIEPSEDHIRYYKLCDKDKPKVLIDGVGDISRNDDFHLL